MKYYLVSDFRENYPTTLSENGILFNDHPTRKSILEILNIIQKLGFDCELFGGINELIKSVNSHRKYENTFFINLSDGMSQEYGRVQAPVLLEILNVPYSGSDVFGSALMNNKYYSKRALDQENILMPKDTLVTEYIDFDNHFIQEVGFPVIVKPNHEGSSVGISQNNVCMSMDKLRMQIEKLLPLYKELIIEEMIVGKDLTDLIIGNPGDIRINEAIITELHNKNPMSIYGAVEKVQKNRNLFLADTIFEKETIEKIHTHSEKIFKYLHASDIARIDYRMSEKDNQLYFLEINSAPRFSLNTEIGFICQKRNWPYERILKEYLETSLKRNLIKEA